MAGKEEPWIVYCEWCDKAIIRGQKRMTTEYGCFCSQNCLFNYNDENRHAEIYTDTDENICPNCHIAMDKKEMADGTMRACGICSYDWYIDECLEEEKNRKDVSDGMDAKKVR